MNILFDWMPEEEAEAKTRTFKDFAAEDIHAVFLNNDEFAEKRTIRYDGKTYEDVLVVPIGPEDTKRTTLTQSWSDHTQGLYKWKLTAYVAKEDIGGVLPEKETILEISDADDPEYFYHCRVANSLEESGMILLALEENYE